MDEQILISIPSPTTGTENSYEIGALGYYYSRKTKTYLHRDLYFQKFPNESRAKNIHHINGKKTDNRMENLIALKAGIHKRLHHEFPMWNLPTREMILEWLKIAQCMGGLKKKRISKKQKRSLRKAYNKKLRRIKSMQRPAKLKKAPRTKPQKVFTPRYIVRKALQPRPTD